MYFTAVMHTDNCTQHMNTYLRKGVRRDSSGRPMVTQGQSCNRTDSILKSRADTAIEDAISSEAEEENKSSVWPLAYDIHPVFNQQFYHIFIIRNVVVCLLSDPITLFYSIFSETKLYSPPVSLLYHHLLLFLFFSAPVGGGISGIAGRPVGP